MKKHGQFAFSVDELPNKPVFAIIRTRNFLGSPEKKESGLIIEYFFDQEDWEEKVKHEKSLVFNEIIFACKIIPAEIRTEISVTINS